MRVCRCRASLLAAGLCCVQGQSVQIISVCLCLCAETLLDDFMLTHPIFLAADRLQQVLLQQYPSRARRHACLAVERSPRSVICCGFCRFVSEQLRCCFVSFLQRSQVVGIPVTGMGSFLLQWKNKTWLADFHETSMMSLFYP